MRNCPKCGAQYSDDLAYCPNDGTATTLVVASGSPADPLIGSTIDGRYRIESKLGEGGMGVVYRASHVVLKKALAIKVMRSEQAQDGEVVQRFVQEAQSSSAIGHANIIGISDFGTTGDGSVYFAMEFLEGQTLGKAMEQGPLPSERAIGIFLQITSALEAAHQRGIVHRDLKPDNIFLVKRGNQNDFVKILDFGIAKVKNAAAKITRTGMVFGTPHYMSPEQAAGQAVDHRSDIYSLGVIMFQVFAGQLPFDAESYMGVMTKHMFDDPPRPSGVLPILRGSIEDIILMALAKKPEQRYQSMLDIKDDLERVQRGQRAQASERASMTGGDTLAFATAPHLAAASPSAGAAPQGGARSSRSESASASVVSNAASSTGSDLDSMPAIPIRKRPVWLWPAIGVGIGAGLVVMLTSSGSAPPPSAAATVEPAKGDESQPAPTPAPAPAPAPSAAPGQVRVVALPEQAEITLDGAALGHGEAQVARPASGRVSIVVRAEGYLPKTVSVDAQSPELIRVGLEAEPKAASTGKPRPHARPQPTAASSPTAPAKPAPRRSGGLNDVVDPWQ